MSIIKAEKLEIEIQEQKIKDAGCKYLILIRTKEKLQQKLKIITTNQKPIIKSIRSPYEQLNMLIFLDLSLLQLGRI